MEEEVHKITITAGWMSKLPKILLGDIAAATISATAIAPIITAIDRAVVENAASSNRPLLSTLKHHILCSLRQPRLFFAAKPFFYVWTLYAATYTTANVVESTAKVLTTDDKLLVSSTTFISTCLVNVPLGVWKDIRFVQLFGRPSSSMSALSRPSSKGVPKSSPVTNHSVPVAKFPRLVGITFLLRDAITIFGSINLPPMLNSSVPDSVFSSPAMKMATMQIFTPVLSQVFATPIHLLGLDLYNNPDSTSKDRTSRIRKSLGPTTAMRCSRIIPAFGMGLVLNTGLRTYFHDISGSIEIDR